MTRPETWVAALEIVEALQAHDETEEILDATAYVVRCHDPETGVHRDTFVGPFAALADALAYADEWSTALNRGAPPGEPLFETSVRPLFAPRSVPNGAGGERS